MNIVRRMISGLRQKSLQHVSDRGWTVINEPYTGAWQADRPVSVETQLAFFAVYACVTLISSDMGKLRPKLIEKKGNIWQETSSPAYSPVLRRPNRFQNHIQFKEAWAISKLLRGNAYGLKQRDGRGIVTDIYPLDPSLVTPLVSEGGDVFYRLKADRLSGLKEPEVVVPARDIIHDRMNCLFHPLVGISPLYASAYASGQGLAVQRQGKSFFANGARPGGVLTAPGEISQATADRLKEYWNTNFSGDNSGKVAVLGDGLHYEQMAMNSTDAQMVEQLKLTGEQVCSAFRVPAFKVGIGSMPTFQNGEIRDQGYYSDCLQSMIEQFELCMDDGLGIGEGVSVGGRVLGVELDLDGLLRMDRSTRIKTLGEGVRGSILTVNEARQREDLPAVPGGDSIWMQQQNYSLEALQKRDEADPFAQETPAPPPADDADDQTDRALQLLNARSAEDSLYVA